MVQPNNNNMTLDGNILKSQAIKFGSMNVYLEWLDKIYNHIATARRFNQVKIDDFLIKKDN
jgi:hypothetical protein